MRCKPVPFAQQEVAIDCWAIPCTPTEAEMLRRLARGCVVPSGCRKRGWYIGRLRRKLPPGYAIANEYDIGYRLVKPAEAFEVGVWAR